MKNFIPSSHLGSVLTEELKRITKAGNIFSPLCVNECKLPLFSINVQYQQCVIDSLGRVVSNFGIINLHPNKALKKVWVIMFNHHNEDHIHIIVYNDWYQRLGINKKKNLVQEDTKQHAVYGEHQQIHPICTMSFN